MKGNEYQKLALRTANTECKNLVNCALGLTGEAGEFADMVKKKEFHGHDLNTEKAVKELGDVMWYIAVAASCLGFTLEEVMETNIEKLRMRYPNGFTSADSIARVDVGKES